MVPEEETVMRKLIISLVATLALAVASAGIVASIGPSPANC